MKNVLFATTALVAFAGAAVAGSDNFVLTGNTDFGSNSITGFYINGDATLTATKDFDYGVSVSVSSGASWVYGNSIVWGDPTVVITSEWVTLTMGDVDHANDHFSGTPGLAGTNGFDTNSNFMLRLDGEVSGIAMSVSNENANAETSVGVSGAFGAVSFGLGFDLGGDIGVNAGGSFSGFDVAVAYTVDQATNSSMGIEVGTAFGATAVSAYYAVNSNADNAFGGAADMDFGGTNVGVYVDMTTTGPTTFGATVSNAVTDTITVGANAESVGGVLDYEAYAKMAIASGGLIGASYSLSGTLDYLAAFTVFGEFSF